MARLTQCIESSDTLSASKRTGLATTLRTQPPFARHHLTHERPAA